jgi:hypothetical protein
MLELDKPVPVPSSLSMVNRRMSDELERNSKSPEAVPEDLSLASPMDVSHVPHKRPASANEMASDQSRTTTKGFDVQARTSTKGFAVPGPVNSGMSFSMGYSASASTTTSSFSSSVLPWLQNPKQTDDSPTSPQPRKGRFVPLNIHVPHPSHGSMSSESSTSPTSKSQEQDEKRMKLDEDEPVTPRASRRATSVHVKAVDPSFGTPPGKHCSPMHNAAPSFAPATPRFHRVKVNMSPLGSPMPSPDVSHGKQSWFNAIFQRRPSLDTPNVPLFDAAPFPPAAILPAATTLPAEDVDESAKPDHFSLV